MTPLSQYPTARKVVYLLFWVVGLIIGSIAVYLAVATNQPTPGWLKGAQAVLAFLAVPIGYTAAANVVDTTKIAAVQPPDAPAGELVAGPAATEVPEGAPADVVPADSASAAADTTSTATDSGVTATDDAVSTPQPDAGDLQAYLEQSALDQGIADPRKQGY